MKPFRFKSLLFLSGILTILSFHCYPQSIYYEKLLERKINDAIAAYSKGDIGATYTAHENFKKLSPAGAFDKKKQKTGKWTEYSVDTTYFGMQYSTLVNNVKLNLYLDASLRKHEGNYVNGLKEGEWRGWISFSRSEPFLWEVDEISNYKNGLKHGLEKKYYEYPYLAYEIVFTNGKEDTIRYYYPKRILMREMVRTGETFKIEKENYPEGKQKVLKKTEVKAGVKKEKLYYYTEAGNLLEEAEVNALGFYEGEVKRYYENGVLRSSGNYRDTIPQGDWKEYYENGKLKFECRLNNGSLDGYYKFYHPNGQLWTERLYAGGKLREVLSNFDSTGNPREKGSLKNGNGTVKTYDGDGNLVQETLYKDGLVQK